MNIDKVLIIGCGGIGSFLIEHIYKRQRNGQIDGFIDFSIADDDMVEMNQVKYQNFSITHAGETKSTILGQLYGFKAINKRIEDVKQLKGYDLIILCVDNDYTRKMVVEYCHKKGVEFIDLRATGRRYFAMPKTTLKENMKFIDSEDKGEYSCQEKADLEKGLFQMGNEIVATIGCQMLLNILRGNTNRIINGVV